MYLFGVSWAGDSKEYVMTRVFRKMRDLRMTYTLESSEAMDQPVDAHSISKRLSDLYNDRRFVIINPRFSQVGRPTVKVEMRPRLFVSAREEGGHDIPGQVSAVLRKALLPVESVIITDKDEWKSDDGRGYGGDYTAPVKDLLEFLFKIEKEGRLIFKDGYQLPDLKAIISSCVLPEDGSLRATILSIAVPVWFGEHKKQLKTHSAGGRVQI